jgi:hypothetical protein
VGGWLAELNIDTQERNSSQYKSDHMRGCRFVFPQKTEAAPQGAKVFRFRATISISPPHANRSSVTFQPYPRSVRFTRPPTYLRQTHPDPARFHVTYLFLSMAAVAFLRFFRLET